VVLRFELVLLTWLAVHPAVLKRTRPHLPKLCELFWMWPVHRASVAREVLRLWAVLFTWLCSFYVVFFIP